MEYYGSTPFPGLTYSDLDNGSIELHLHFHVKNTVSRNQLCTIPGIQSQNLMIHYLHLYQTQTTFNEYIYQFKQDITSFVSQIIGSLLHMFHMDPEASRVYAPSFECFNTKELRRKCIFGIGALILSALHDSQNMGCGFSALAYSSCGPPTLQCHMLPYYISHKFTKNNYSWFMSFIYGDLHAQHSDMQHMNYTPAHTDKSQLRHIMSLQFLHLLLSFSSRFVMLPPTLLAHIHQLLIDFFKPVYSTQEIAPSIFHAVQLEEGKLCEQGLLKLSSLQKHSTEKSLVSSFIVPPCKFVTNRLTMVLTQMTTPETVLEAHALLRKCFLYPDPNKKIITKNSVSIFCTIFGCHLDYYCMVQKQILNLTSSTKVPVTLQDQVALCSTWIPVMQYNNRRLRKTCTTRKFEISQELGNPQVNNLKKLSKFLSDAELKIIFNIKTYDHDYILLCLKTLDSTTLNENHHKQDVSTTTPISGNTQYWFIDYSLTQYHDIYYAIWITSPRENLVQKAKLYAATSFESGPLRKVISHQNRSGFASQYLLFNEVAQENSNKSMFPQTSGISPPIPAKKMENSLFMSEIISKCTHLPDPTSIFEEFDQAMSLNYKEEAEFTQMGSFTDSNKIEEMKYQHQSHFQEDFEFMVSSTLSNKISNAMHCNSSHMFPGKADDNPKMRTPQEVKTQEAPLIVQDPSFKRGVRIWDMHMHEGNVTENGILELLQVPYDNYTLLHIPDSISSRTMDPVHPCARSSSLRKSLPDGCILPVVGVSTQLVQSVLRLTDGVLNCVLSHGGYNILKDTFFPQSVHYRDSSVNYVPEKDTSVEFVLRRVQSACTQDNAGKSTRNMPDELSIPRNRLVIVPDHPEVAETRSPLQIS